MALRDDIQSLRDRTLTDLIAADDYFTETKIAWHIATKAIQGGASFSIRSMTTGSLITHGDLVSKAISYMDDQLARTSFQEIISLFEHFFFNLLRLWLTAHPQSLVAKQVSFKDILEAPDRDTITLLVVNKELNEVLYKKPTDWFAYLEDRAKLGCPTATEVDQIAEAKASRDILAHNRGVANKTYEAKAGRLARYKDGEKIDIPEDYHRETWRLIRKLVTDLSNAAIAKAP